MPDIYTLMPIFMTISLFAGAALHSKSLMLGSGATFMALGYIAVRSENTMFLGVYLLCLFFMVMGSAVFMVRTIMGDTA